MKEYFQTSVEYNLNIQNDLLLYNAAVVQLDKTIDDVIGRDVFNQQLIQYQKIKQIVNSKCITGNNTILYPCMDGGIRHANYETDCLWKDSGCGTKCLDTIATENKLW